MTLTLLKDKTEPSQTTVQDIKSELAEALCLINALYNQNDDEVFTAKEKYEGFNEAMSYICDTLAIDLDMHELVIKGELPRNHDDNSDTKTLERVLDTNRDTLTKELQDLYSLNGSMFSDDPNSVPKFTDGTRIRPQDLADMNMNSIEQIAEMIGIEIP